MEEIKKYQQTDTSKIRLYLIVCSDRRMDIVDINYTSDTPINKYEINCDVCHFPNIDKTPYPYFIVKGRDFSGIEITKADLGNLFVSNRLKKIFEILFPEQCEYKRTFIAQTDIPTKWWLAVPNNTIISGEVKDDVKRCEKCNQPLHAHPGSQYKFWIHDFESSFDIIKSENWHSVAEHDWKETWIGRDIYLSVRLIFLLKKNSAKGIYQYAFSEFKKLTKAEKDWIEQAIEKIGDLKSNTKTEVTKEAIEKFKRFYSIISESDLKSTKFEMKFKISVNEIVKNICNIEYGTEINIGFDTPFVVEQIENWKSTNTKPKLIAFAFDEFGNDLRFNPKDKNCPLYFYDHEIMIYDLIQESILNLTET
jgi:hypothetical protein